MPKITGWTRRQNLEGGDVKYVWESDYAEGYPQFLGLRRREDGFVAEYEMGLWSSEEGVQSQQVMPDRRVGGNQDESNGLYDNLSKAQADAYSWMEDHKGDVSMENLDLEDEKGWYELQQVTDDLVEYVAEVDVTEADAVIIQLKNAEFSNRDPVYTVDGLIMKDGQIATDFRPTTRNQFSNPLDAYEVLKDVLTSGTTPEDYVSDFGDRI